MNETTITIEKPGGRGVGIGRLNGKAVFVPFSATGDTILLKIEKEKKSFIRGKIAKLITPSHHRREAPCPYAGTCGGCAYQHIEYAYQLEYKKGLIKEIFRKFPEVPTEPVTPSPMDMRYRNKIHLQCASVKGKLITGYYAWQSKKLIDIKSCPLCSDRMNSLIANLKEILEKYKLTAFPKGWGDLKDIIIHQSGENNKMTCTLITRNSRVKDIEQVSRELIKREPLLKGFFLYHNPHKGDIAFRDNADISLSGPGSPLKTVTEGFLTDKVAGVTFNLTPVGFFQINRGQTENIIQTIKEILKPEETSNKGLVDAYAGAGTLSLPLAGLFREILAVEYVGHSVELAQQNSRENNIDNFKPIKGDAAAVLAKRLKSDPDFTEKFPYLLLDPPRSGLSEKLRTLAAKGKFRQIIYLSCDPHTQARDIEAITAEGKYELTRIIPFDMFPQTFHIENLAILKKRA